MNTILKKISVTYHFKYMKIYKVNFEIVSKFNFNYIMLTLYLSNYENRNFKFIKFIDNFVISRNIYPYISMLS
jgi:hypothetical protein